jgi:endonuclease YncB( thermonuclease family)
MRRLPILALALLAAAAPAGARDRARQGAEIELDGAPTAVRWTDGDTIRIQSGPWRGRSARLEGYNTLETYGPVHRWGTWSPHDLLALARAAAPVAASRRWTCVSSGREDRYGRLLVACPGAALELVRRGLAMVYAIDGPADPALLRAQEEAQRRGDGLWSRGVPRGIVTSVHSAAESPSGSAYDRVVDTTTGAAAARRHALRYRTCELVCEGEGVNRTCMVYVPFERRYRHRPACLRR